MTARSRLCAKISVKIDMPQIYLGEICSKISAILWKCGNLDVISMCPRIWQQLRSYVNESFEGRQLTSLSMEGSFWLSSPGKDQDSSCKSFLGVFTADPFVIGSNLPRPPSPLPAHRELAHVLQKSQLSATCHFLQRRLSHVPTLV